MQGKIVPTKVDAQVAEIQKKYEGMPFEFVIERVDPMSVFSYRWHPFAIDRNVDYSREPMTLVTFELSEAADGTMLRIVESGFDALPAGRRNDALEANEEGWEFQAQILEKYLAMHAK